MDKEPTPGYCPHCKNELKPSATACNGCGAFETSAWDQLGIWKIALLYACFVVSPIIGFGIVLMSSPLVGWAIFFGPMVGYFAYRSKSKKKLVWAAGSRRVV